MPEKFDAPGQRFEPFKYGTQPMRGIESAETVLKEFVTKTGEKIERFIVKEAALENPKEVFGRYKKAYDLLRSPEYNLEQFLPKTEFIIGHGPEKKPTLFIVQEKISGKTLRGLEEVNSSYIYDLDISAVEQIDEILYRSLVMWEKTYLLADKSTLPQAIPEDYYYTHRMATVEENSGVMPEIVNPGNIMIGRKENDKSDRVYLTDTHSVIVFSDYELHKIGEMLETTYREVVFRLEAEGKPTKSADLFRDLTSKYPN